MKLTIADGTLSYGSVYKLFFVGVLCSVGLFVVLFISVYGVAAVASGRINWNGEDVTGTLPVLIRVLPLLIGIPLFMLLYSAILSAFFTIGVLMYRWGRPLQVTLD